MSEEPQQQPPEPQQPAPEPEPNGARRDQHVRAQLQAERVENARLKAEVEQLRGWREAQLRKDIEGMVGGTRKLVDGRAIWFAGTQPSDLVGEDGTPDEAKINTAIEALLHDHQYLKAAGPAALPGNRPQEAPVPTPTPALDFAGVVKGLAAAGRQQGPPEP
jgi:hypothetical protein